MIDKTYSLEAISMVLNDHPEIPDDIKQSVMSEMLGSVLDTFKNALNDKSEISDETKRAVMSEINMNILAGRGRRIVVAEVIADYLRDASDVKFESAKKEMGKYALMKPNFSINKKDLSDEQIHALLWTCISYVKEYGNYDDFVKQILDK